MGVKKTLLGVLNANEDESKQAFSLLGMGFFMGIFLATLDVGAASLFLNNLTEQQVEDQLPLAILVSGILGIIFTAIYNFFQNRISFSTLGLASLFIVALILFGIEVAFRNLEDPLPIYFFAFTFIVPANFMVLLVFWGSFGRMFNLRQAKRIIGGIDTGQLIASIIALFSIPIILKYATTQNLLFISLIAIVGDLLMFFYITRSNQFQTKDQVKSQSISYGKLVQNPYIALMAIFVIISMVGINFVDYSFLTVTTSQFDENELPTFLSLFEATVVIFSFLFQTFITDKIIALYGLKVSLLINPFLLVIFTALAIPIGYSFGYRAGSETIIFFFIIIAMSKLFISSLKDALDGPAFKLYFLPIDSTIRFDVQTKIEGVVTAFAGLVAGGLIILINNVQVFTLIHISIFTLPMLFLWYYVTNKMHNNYKHTLQDTLIKNKEKSENTIEKEYSVGKVLENEINSKADQKVLYGLKLMEKIEPALFESSIVKLLDSDSSRIVDYAKEKIKILDLEFEKNSEFSSLAKKAVQDSEDTDIISVPADKLGKLSKSFKNQDRILAAKLLRKLINPKNIFILLELLRDIDPRVKMEAIITARKVKRPETWGILVEMLNSSTFSNAAASALVEAGEAGLFTLESAFHKSGQTDHARLKIVQIIGRIGGPKAVDLLWNKIEHPDRRIVRQILLSFRYFNYQASDRQVSILTNLLENEMGKVLWNLAALTEIPKLEHFKFLRNAIKEEIAENYDTVYMYMSILYDPQSVHLVRENIESNTSEGIAFAIELCDLFLSQELKPKFFPLVDDIPINEKIIQLQGFFPRENYNLVQVLNYLLNKNYNQVNRWTKACTIHCLAFVDEFRVSRGLIAQLFNNDSFLQEVAAWVMYNKDKQIFHQISERLSVEVRKLLKDTVEKNSLVGGLHDGNFMGIEMVMFLKTVPFFKDIKGLLLCDLVDKMSNTNLKPNEVLRIPKHEDEERIYVVADGEIFIKKDDMEIGRVKKGQVYGNLFRLEGVDEGDTIVAFGDAVVFNISVYDFYNVMANHHELAQGFIKNIEKTLKKVVAD
jgi:ATP:ADP antiporter, AAA family